VTAVAAAGTLVATDAATVGGALVCSSSFSTEEAHAATSRPVIVSRPIKLTIFFMAGLPPDLVLKIVLKQLLLRMNYI
jgi:hypothetical protein